MTETTTETTGDAPAATTTVNATAETPTPKTRVANFEGVRGAVLNELHAVNMLTSALLRNAEMLANGDEAVLKVIAQSKEYFDEGVQGIGNAITSL